MRTKAGPLRVLTPLAAAVMLMTSCVGCASTSQRQWGTCAGIGALVGGLGGGASGLAIAEYTRGSHHENAKSKNAYGYGLGGVAIGAILGAAIGHAVCDPEPSRNVSYYRPNASSSGTTPNP